MLQIRFLGQYDLRLDGQPVEISSRPAQSLFAYLVCHPHKSLPREMLAGLFWPQSPEANARSSLRHALWRIRQALGPAAESHVQADDLTIRFVSQAEDQLDVAILEAEFDPQAGIDQETQNLSVYQGEFLPGFYDEWVVVQRQYLHSTFEHKVHRLLHALALAGRWSEVLSWSEGWIRLAHSPEPAYQALMLAHAALGDLASASIDHQRCSKVLHRDLGIEPSPLTHTIYQHLLLGERPEDLLAEMWPSPAKAAMLLMGDEAPSPGRAPYKGLQYFEEADAGIFFGRERLVSQLIDHLLQAPYLAVVVGASGSGKSSLLRAGFIPALRGGLLLPDGTQPTQGSDRWRIRVFTPTDRPLHALAAALTGGNDPGDSAALVEDLAKDSGTLRRYTCRKFNENPGARPRSQAMPGGDVRSLLVIDQFEDVFSLCRDESQRRAFIDNLLPDPDSETVEPIAVVIALRADYYANCAQYENLRQALTHDQVYAGPMTAAELRRAIEEPARREGWKFERGLVDLFLREAGSEPGRLPLLSHALLETWNRRSGRTLTFRGYAASGGVRAAISQTAERIYQRLSPAQQAFAREVFLRLTELGDQGDEGQPAPDTRRPVARAELLSNSEPGSSERAEQELVLKTLADARLLTLEREIVQVSHEALIREWATLRAWLAQDRQALLLHRHLTQAALGWEELNREPGELYRGARLAQVEEWAREHSGQLNALERAYLEASGELAAQQEAEKEAQRQREIQAARQLAAEQRQRAEEQAQYAQRLRRRAAYLVMALLVALALIGITLFFGRQAAQSASLAAAQQATAENNAALAAEAADLAQSQQATAESESRVRATAQAAAVQQRQVAEEQTRLTRSRELALAAINNLESDPELSILLALEGIATQYTQEAESALHRGVLDSHLVQRSDSGGFHTESPLYSPDGTKLFTLDYLTNVLTTTLVARDSGSGEILFTYQRHVEPGSKILAAMDMSPDGKNLILGYSANPEILVLDASSGRQLHSLDISQDLGQTGCMLNMFIQPPGVYSVAVHPDGRRVATLECGRGQWTPRVRDLQTGEVLMELPSFDLIHFRLRVAFSPDGSILAVPTREGTVTLYDATSGEVLHILQHIQDIDQLDETVTRLAFDPGGDRIATAGTDGMAVVWDLPSGERLFAIDSGSPEIWGLAYNLDGTLLATGAPDGKVRLWDARTGQALRTLPGSDERVNDVNFNPAGTQLAATAAGILYVWDLTPDHELFTYQQAAPFYGLELSADGSRLATADTDGEVEVFNAATGMLVQKFRAQPTYIYQATFNPIADQIATAGGDAIAKIFDASSGQQLTSFDTGSTVHDAEVTSVAFSPDGQRLATINPVSQSIEVWDISSGRQVMSTTTASTFGFGLILFDPQEGRLIATESHTSTVILDPTSGQELLAVDTSFLPDGLIALALDADGDQLAGGGFDGTVIIWDSHSGQELLRINAHEGPVWAMVYSPDGQLLATGSVDGTVKIWDAASGVLRLDLGGDRDAVSSIEFSPDGRYLYTDGYDGSLRSYVLSLDELIALAKSRLTRSFTPDECRQYRIEACPAAP